MLTPELLNSVKSHTDAMTQKVTLVLNQGTHEKRAELVKFLTDLSQVSDKIDFQEQEMPHLRSAVSFALQVEGKDTGIVFSGIPGGHEFTSLILAILQSGGCALKLDAGIQKLIKKIQQPLEFSTFISLSCHNCPEIVQALNQFALLNDYISSEMIDGGLFPELVEQKNIQGVPSVFLNGDSFANGKIDAAALLEKLLEQHPQITQQGAAANDEPATVTDVAIIGGGPAGAAAAIYTARKGFDVTLIADRIGGQVQDTMDIENFISVSRTTGPKLSSDLKSHLEDYQIHVRENLSVKAFEPKTLAHSITLNTGEVIEAKSVIVATGAKWRELGVPGEKENIGNGVAYCPHCDGPFFKGKDVAVIGGGNSGVEAALDLAGIVKSVTVFEFMPELKADKVLVDKLKQRDNVRVITNAQTQQVNAQQGKVTSLTYIDRATNAPQNVELAGIFVQIGLIPNSEFLVGKVATSQHGEIVINEKCQTNIEGVFACGDVTTVPYKQIVVSMGEGSKAALSASDYLLMNLDRQQQKVA